MQKSYRFRSSIVFLFFSCAYAIAILNLYIIQIRHRKFYSTLGKKQYQVTVTSPSVRGVIYDRNGQLLAMNKESISAFILPRNVEQEDKLKQFFKRHFPYMLERLEQNREAHFLYVKRKLTDEQKKVIEESGIDDIKFLAEPSRFYPISSVGTIVGITDIDTIGLFGMELLYNEILAGKPTTYWLEKDARLNFYFKQETKVAGRQGQPITLTIDGNLQFLVYEELKSAVQTLAAQEGAVIVMNPSNGEILAMANYPDFDPNATVDSLDVQNTKNRIVTDAYELGSVFKVFTALAAFHEGVVTPDELIDCQNSKSAMVDGIKINTWKAHGVLPFDQVIQVSNNIGTCMVAKRLGAKLYDHLIGLGFGKKTGIDFPGEQKGWVNPPSRWTTQSILSLSYGYEVSATLLQLATAFCVIANDGYAVQPQLVLHKTCCQQPAQPQERKRLYNQQTINQMRDLLTKTVTQGTAHHAAIGGYTIMGKTGTANMLINGKYQSDHNLFTFVGLVQKDDYKRVIVTFIKDLPQKNIYASSIAAPLFEAIAQKVIIHDKIIL